VTRGVIPQTFALVREGRWSSSYSDSSVLLATTLLLSRTEDGKGEVESASELRVDSQADCFVVLNSVLGVPSASCSRSRAHVVKQQLREEGLREEIPPNTRLGFNSLRGPTSSLRSLVEPEGGPSGSREEAAVDSDSDFDVSVV
jgi:hypothetical protein